MITYIDNNETHTLNLDTDIVLIGANRSKFFLKKIHKINIYI